jgi:molecular chaperone GrpE
MTKHSEKNETPHEPTPAPGAEPVDVVVENETPDEVTQLTAQVAELKDKLLRTQAEWDNSRKRLTREKEEAVRYAAEGFLEKLLPVIDNFEMGMQASKSATDAKSIAQGFEMVLAQFKQVLRDSGVEAVEAVGQPFDPHRHEALGHQESTEIPEGHVLSQMRKGYKLKDRLLRPASVFVAKAPEGKESR